MNFFETLLAVAYIAAYFVIPFGLGALLCRALRVKEYSLRTGLVLFTIGLGLAPFLNQIVRGNSPWDAIPLAIDLAGGTNLVYELDAPEGEPLTAELREQMVGAVSRRINPAGTKEVTVRSVGRDRIEVIIPGANPAAVEEAKDLMTRLGSLEFSIVADQSKHRDLIQRAMASPAKDVRVSGKVLAAWREVAPTIVPDGSKDGKAVPNTDFDGDPSIAIRQVRGKPEGFKEILVLVEPAENMRITGKLLRRANPTYDGNGRPAVGFHFNQQGAFLFQQLTTKYKPLADGTKYKLAILLDEKVFSAPQIRQPIGGDGIIEGKFTEKEVQDLVSVLNAGALPIPLKKDPISEFTISPTLGSDVQSKGKLALWVSTLAVIAFMGVYYLLAGAVANFALLLNLLLIVSVMSIIDAAFSLPGLAGLVLSAGMAVDANVLIYERIREELQRGASLRLAIHNGFDRAFTAIFDSNLTSIITAVILYWIGTEQVRGFAVALFIGLVMNLYTAIFVSRLVLNIMERGGLIKTLKMMSVIGVTNFDFVGKQRPATIASLILIAAGLIAFASRGQENYDIDFTGGTMVSMQFTEPQDTDEVRTALETRLGTNITLEELSRAGEGASKGHLFRLRTTDQDQMKVQSDINATFPDKLARVKMTAGDPQPIPEAAAPKDGEKPAPAADVADEYRGGQRVELAFSQNVSIPTIARYLRNSLQAHNIAQPESVMMLTGTAGPGAGKEEGQVRLFDKMELLVTKDVPTETLQTVIESVETTLQNSPLFEEVTSFESSVAEETKLAAVIAVMLSLIAIVAYVWFRFQNLVFGIAAVTALAHDVLVALGCVALAAYLSNTPIGPLLMLNDFKVNMPMIAAFLTIVGYSLNDTIVIFDRLREVRGKNPIVTRDMLNLTVNQTLSRTLLTALTVFITVLILYVLGGEGIHGFAFTMVIGSIAGTYSTVYIASPMVLWLMERERRLSGAKRNTSNKSQTAAASG